ncbi:hypothetical protein ABAC460_01465 [Asticcacaulis sp. AC460]|uniref:energy transducer TonB n=1 Tax=Asticcacaulis sp. AC460 TaxID=1282360 RepID=UPI0003C3F1AE|nr:energy transducer TonB [Asticcacaulis sp. AC460]ESQ92944.1 hypothetical protein ABAC460_01465 [Asticcacaulis sp. AC460]
MKIRSAVLALVVAMTAASEASAFDPPPDARIYTRADFPADAPQAAPYLDNGTQTGAATVSCLIADDRRYSQCYIVEETPAGAGFAEAAMKTLLTQGRWGGLPGLWREQSFEYRPPNPELKYYTLADFPNLPETLDTTNLYPPKARTEEIEGTVTIDCRVGENGRYERCAVLSEAPKDYGFGEATAAWFLSGMRTTQPRGAVQKMTMKWAF